MPNFTEMDPSLIASFWIYFVGSFIGGLLLGIFVAKLFFRREKSLLVQEKQVLEQEKSNFSGKLEQFEIMQQNLKEKSEELNRLREEISKSEEYWAAKMFTKQEGSGNKALYDMFHSNQKK